MNRILCFDTSNNHCSVAIANGQEILSLEQELRPSMQAERLMVLVESALNKARLKYKDIEYVAVTIGPGSFTGIRISLAAAKGIMHATGARGVAINSFEYSYYRLQQQINAYDKAIILINAYRQQQYVQVFEPHGPAMAPKLINNSQICDLINSYSGQIVCAGSGCAQVYNDIKHIPNILILPRFQTVKANHLARLADHKICQYMFGSMEPLYIRPPDAIPAIV